MAEFRFDGDNYGLLHLIAHDQANSRLPSAATTRGSRGFWAWRFLCSYLHSRRGRRRRRFALLFRFGRWRPNGLGKRFGLGDGSLNHGFSYWFSGLDYWFLDFWRSFCNGRFFNVSHNWSFFYLSYNWSFF